MKYFAKKGLCKIINEWLTMRDSLAKAGDCHFIASWLKPTAMTDFTESKNRAQIVHYLQDKKAPSLQSALAD